MTQLRLEDFPRPVLGDEPRPRNSAWSDLLRLYRSNAVFRTSSEIAVIGLMVLLAASDFSTLSQRLANMARYLSSGPVGTDTRNASKVSASIGLPGNASLQSLKKRGISDQVKVGEPPAVVQVVDAVNDLLKQDEIVEAVQLVSKHDQSNPVIAYAKAVTGLRLSGSSNFQTSLRLLTYAAQNGVSDASTMLGEVYLSALRMDLASRLPSDYRILIDSTGAVHPASVQDISDQARLWLEKAAGQGQVRALRFLGLMKARGLGGPMDLVSAAALWRRAADQGDNVAQFEIGSMLAFGQGIEANSGDAIKYLRKASRSLNDAKFALASVLFANAVAGKPDAANEAISLASAFTGNTDNPEKLAMANKLLAELYFRVAPSANRDAAKAVQHFRAATYFGSPSATYQLAEFYRWGTYVTKDAVRAFALYSLAVKRGYEPARQSLTELAKDLSAGEIGKAKRITIHSFEDLKSKGAVGRRQGPGVLQAMALTTELISMH